ncbi:UNVERIFIED_CONTAM: hypothetical protein GTU68_046216 [Idotea baltica]|nr:hypothetical protein [Idotea baltica]
MLVITRRQNQKVVFPDLGISVTLVGAKSGSARIGVDAPRNIKILRDEIADKADLATPQTLETPNHSGTDQHALRNVLNSLNLFSLMYKAQLQSDQPNEAASTFMKMVDFLEEQMGNGLCDFEIASPKDSQLQGRVMLVEDDNNQRDLLSGFLRSKGLAVEAFTNGRDAFDELADGSRPGVVLLDWAMPDFGGKWLVPKITDTFGSSRPQLFVLSGSENVTQAERDSVDAWLPKPLNQTVLLKRLEAACSVAC